MKPTALLLTLALLTLPTARATEDNALFQYRSSETVSTPAQVKRGGVLRLALPPWTSPSLNPLGSSSSGPSSLPLFAPLLVWDKDTGRYRGMMAQSFSTSDGGRTYTFTLRPGLKWSDGTPITAADFVSSYAIHQAQKRLVGMSVQTLEPLRFSLTFPRAAGGNLDELAFAVVLPDHVFGVAFRSGGLQAAQALWPATQDPATLVVSGPFVLERYQPGVSLSLVRNPRYGEWVQDAAGGALPYLQGIEYRFESDPLQRLERYRTDELDSVVLVGSQAASLVASPPPGGVLIGSQGSSSVDFWVPNRSRLSSPAQQAWFRQPRFRQALSLALDKAAMNLRACAGTCTPVWTSVPPMHSEWVAPGVNQYAFDRARANALLDSLQFTNRDADGIRKDRSGVRLSFSVLTNVENARRTAMAQQIQADLREVGIEVRLDLKPFAEVLGAVYSSPNPADRAFDTVITGLSGGGILGTPELFQAGGSLNAANATKSPIEPWETQLLNAVTGFLNTADLAERKTRANQVQAIQSENQGTIYLLSQNVYSAWTTRLRGEFPAVYQSGAWTDLTWGPRSLDLSWLE